MNMLGWPLLIFSVVITVLGLVGGWLAWLTINTTPLWGNMLWNYIVAFVLILVALGMVIYGILSLVMSLMITAS